MGKNIIMVISAVLMMSGQIISQHDSLILSEVMFYPSSSNSEFIEVYNNTDDKFISLAGYKFIYETSSADNIVPAGTDSIIGPGQYAVIFEGDYDTDTGIYSDIIPDGVLIMKLDNNAFGSAGMANSADRSIKIISVSEDTICTYIYSANNSAGYSDEKIILTNDNTNANWKNSTVLNGTPGFKNSIAPLDFDLKIKAVIIDPEVPIAGIPFTISAVIENRGIQEISSFGIKLFSDINNDSAGTENELVQNPVGTNLLPGDSTTIVFNGMETDTAGSLNLIIRIETAEDENLENNISIFSVTIINPPPDPFDLVINEIMYQPAGDEPEWVELFNRSSKTIDLADWKLGDMVSSVKITNESLKIEPGECIVLSDDGTLETFYEIPSKVAVVKLPSLNNSGDEIKIISPENIIIDSVAYVGVSSDAGKSLERIDPEISDLQDNWAACISSVNGTPGKKNSVSQKDYDGEISGVSIAPEQPAVGDAIKFSAELKNNGQLNSICRIELWSIDTTDDSTKTLLETSETFKLIPSETLLHTFSYEESLDDRQYKYLFKLVCDFDEFIDNNEYSFLVIPSIPGNSIVVNEIMYQPVGDEPEWIELFNRSESAINLKSWQICDENSCVSVYEDILLESQSYLIIADDETFNLFYDSAGEFITVKFPSLNNGGDAILLKDSTGAVIDSIRYTGESTFTGKSLERISFLEDSFSVCVSSQGATPGEINSVSKKQIDGRLVSFSFNPQHLLPGDEVKFEVEIENSGKDNLNYKLSLWSDEDADSTADQLLERSEILSLNPDSINIFNFEYAYQTDEKSADFIASLEVEGDQFPDDNIKMLQIIPGFEYNSVVINEIMYNPESGYPEWIELFNRSDYSVNLADWSIGDNTSISKLKPQENININPNEYLVIISSDDSSNSGIISGAPNFFSPFPSLNNGTDAVVIYDNTGKLIDSVNYRLNTGQGFSLERISADTQSNDTTNWFPSINKSQCTPGAANSVESIAVANTNYVIINEILFDCDSEHYEFVELFNLNEEPVELATLFININGVQQRVSNISTLLYKDEYFVLAADSSILSSYNLDSTMCFITDFSLTNSGGSVSLKDYLGNTPDSINYSSDLHNLMYSLTKNISLEKINPEMSGLQNENWTSSVSTIGATPGSRNSVYINREVSTSSVSITPNPFSPDNDGFEDFTLIDYNLSSTVSFLRVRLYDAKGRLVRSIAENQPAASSGTIIYNGFDDNNSPLRVGIYILLFEAFDQNRNTVSAFKEALVIARKF